MDIKEKFMHEALKEATKALKKDEVPIGAVIVKDDKIIARGHNLRETKQNSLCHAEIIAIREAEKHINDWRLDGCDLYVTLYPCDMCIEVIKAARISNVYYLLEKDNKNKSDYTNIEMLNDNVSRETYKEKLSMFFKDNIR